MPLQLTTPVSVGGLDPDAAGGEYDQIRIENLEFDFVRKKIGLRCVYGNTVSGDWVSGKKEMRIGVQNQEAAYDENGDIIAGTSSTAYDDVVALLPVDDTTPLYTQVGDTLYQWLIDQGYFVGSVVA